MMHIQNSKSVNQNHYFIRGYSFFLVFKNYLISYIQLRTLTNKMNAQIICAEEEAVLSIIRQ